MASAWWRKSYGGLATQTAPAKQSQFLDCGLWIADCGAGTDLSPPARGRRIVQNEPNFRRGRVGRGSGGRGNVRNKANFASRRHRGESCKTNPIPGGAGWDGAWGTTGVGQTCKTNPICRRRACCPWRGRPALASRGHALALLGIGDDVLVAFEEQGQDALATKENHRQALRPIRLRSGQALDDATRHRGNGAKRSQFPSDEGPGTMAA